MPEPRFDGPLAGWYVDAECVEGHGLPPRPAAPPEPAAIAIEPPLTWRHAVIAAALNALCDPANRPLAFLIGAAVVMAIMLRAESPLLALLAGGSATLAPVVMMAGEYRLIRAAEQVRHRS